MQLSWMLFRTEVLYGFSRKKSGEYVDGVGTEEEGFRIIIPWRDTWRFRASGVVEVGYIIAKDAD